MDSTQEVGVNILKVDDELSEHQFEMGKEEPPSPPVLEQPRPPTPPKPKDSDASPIPPVLDLGPRRTSLPPVDSTCCCNFFSGSLQDLIYWRDVKKSGVVFGVTLVLLLCVAMWSVLTVAAYVGLILLALTLSFRIYKAATATVQKTEQTNPFKPYLDKELNVPSSKVHEQVDVVLGHVKDLLHQLRRLFLVENFVDTAKFAVLLWAMTYFGSWFSGMCLIIMAFIGIFTIPKFYETYKEQIDQYWSIAEKHAKTAHEQIEERLPFLKKKQQ